MSGSCSECGHDYCLCDEQGTGEQPMSGEVEAARLDRVNERLSELFRDLDSTRAALEASRQEVEALRAALHGLLEPCPVCSLGLPYTCICEERRVAAIRLATEEGATHG